MGDLSEPINILIGVVVGAFIGTAVAGFWLPTHLSLLAGVPVGGFLGGTVGSLVSR